MHKIIIKNNNSIEYKSIQLFGVHIYWKKLPPLAHNKRRIWQQLDRYKILDEGIFLSICGLNMCREKQFITGVVRLEMARDKIDKAIKHIYAHKMPGCKDNEKSLNLLSEIK